MKEGEGRPPENPVQCASPASSSSCTVSNAYGSWPDGLSCTAAQVVYPTTEAQIMAVVAAAVEKKQKMKVVSRYAHSFPKLMCPGSSDGLLISTRDYNQGLLIDKDSMTAIADSGVELRQLLDALAAQGLALTHSPYWHGVSLGGLLSTGAHGSSFFGKGAAVHEFVIGMRLVTPASAADGFVKVIELNDTHTPELLNAAKVSLGVLGVISKVTLRLESLFKRSITYSLVGDEDLEDQILPFAAAHEFGDVIWNPSLAKATYRLDDRVSVDTPGDGVYEFLGFRPASAKLLLEPDRILEELQEASDDASGKCVTARVEVAGLQLLGYGLRNSGKPGALFTGFPVIGYHHQLQASGSCLYTPEGDRRVCPWDPRIRGLFIFQSAFSIAASKVAAFVGDLKALRDRVVEGFCGADSYLGVYMRFVKASTAYLGKPDDAVDFDVQYYRAREKGRPRLLEDVMEEVEQMAVFKYGGVPHWGKNRPVAFLGVARKYPQLQRFLAVKQQLDPDSLFSNDWTEFALGLTASPQPAALYNASGCALEGLCICSQDAHCAPHLGYLCQPGRVYIQARVCRKVLQ
ncbi:hypothetical protein GOP47_0001304 [Adiantum capillus-veneris]|uniref:L-gulonolactone oxidase n=1 Tax=Adiantum capillus-veneris TaxID=13818 RepID=A0A9D4V991_ADICA|nr:hypothetical protein GOP47_0001304 [Adiantum capillus-veneris]